MFCVQNTVWLGVTQKINCGSNCYSSLLIFSSWKRVFLYLQKTLRSKRLFHFYKCTLIEATTLMYIRRKYKICSHRLCANKDHVYTMLDICLIDFKNVSINFTRIKSFILQKIQLFACDFDIIQQKYSFMSLKCLWGMQMLPYVPLMMVKYK